MDSICPKALTSRRNIWTTTFSCNGSTYNSIIPRCNHLHPEENVATQLHESGSEGHFRKGMHIKCTDA